jgi:hypothetical protein
VPSVPSGCIPSSPFGDDSVDRSQLVVSGADPWVRINTVKGACQSGDSPALPLAPLRMKTRHHKHRNKHKRRSCKRKVCDFRCEIRKYIVSCHDLLLAIHSIIILCMELWQRIYDDTLTYIFLGSFPSITRTIDRRGSVMFRASHLSKAPRQGHRRSSSSGLVSAATV